MNQDKEHLKLLSIFHYVVGGMITLFSCIPIIHLIMGISIILMPESMTDGRGEGPPAFLGWFFVLFPLVFILCGWILGACVIYAGICLGKFKKHTFCLIMAGIVCLFMPVGTVLGVFTIIVLLRPAVKDLFSLSQDRLDY